MVSPAPSSMARYPVKYLALPGKSEFRNLFTREAILPCNMQSQDAHLGGNPWTECHTVLTIVEISYQSSNNPHCYSHSHLSWCCYLHSYYHSHHYHHMTHTSDSTMTHPWLNHDSKTVWRSLISWLVSHYYSVIIIITRWLAIVEKGAVWLSWSSLLSLWLLLPGDLL